VLTRYIHPNITGADESRGPAISHNYERRRDASAYVYFERLFRPAVRGRGLPIRWIGGECAGFA
jgi:hypothetical protein